MKTSTYLILLNAVLPMGILSSASSMSYSGIGRYSRCSLILKGDGYVNHDFFKANFTDCSYVDYWISVDSSQFVVVKLRLELERVNELKDHEVLFEILNNPLEVVRVISKDDFGDPGESVKVVKVVSPRNNVIFRVHRLKSFAWIPFSATYRPKGICLTGQEKCFGEDDCYHRSNRCDGIWDCLENGSDELDCTGCTNSYKCQNKTNSEVLCYTDKCNGRPMCLNGDDQRNCNEKQCNPKTDAFLCRNKRCIRSGWVCDGIDDCRDFSDESFCPTSGSNQVTVIAVTGSISCIILSFIIIWFSCKLYLLRKKRMRERAAAMRGDESLLPGATNGYDERDWWDFFFRDCRPSGRSTRMACHQHGGHHGGQHISPIVEVQNELFARLSAPPPYQIAMATSRSFDEVVAEEMAQRMLAATSDGMSDDELLNSDNPRVHQNASESDDDSLLTIEDATSEGFRGRDRSTDGALDRPKIPKTPNRRPPSGCLLTGSSGDSNLLDEPPTFEEATGERSEVVEGDVRSDGDSGNSDGDSGHVPPSYSSLFPAQQDAEPLPGASDEDANQSDGPTPTTERFSFFKTPLQNLRSMFSNWSRSPNSSSLTELVGDREQLIRSLDRSVEREIQRIVAAGALPLRVSDVPGGRTRRERNLPLNVEVGQSEGVDLLRWDAERRSVTRADRANGSSSFSGGNRRSSGEMIGGRQGNFDTVGMYTGDYNVTMSSDSENDEKDG